MYKVHQDATLLPSSTTTPKIENGAFKADQVSASASRDKDGVIHVSLANLDLNKKATVKVDVRGFKAKAVADAQVVTARNIADYNTFENPDKVELAGFDGAKVGKDGVVTVTMPAMSVVTFAVK